MIAVNNIYMLKLHEIAKFIQQNMPHSVSLPEEADRGSQRRKLNAAIDWCKSEYGQMAFTLPLEQMLELSWKLDESARWDMLGENFCFRSQTDAALFRVFWG
jgi:hypothetical protein